MLLIDLFVETRDVGGRPKAHEAVVGMPNPATWALIQHLGWRACPQQSTIRGGAEGAEEL